VTDAPDRSLRALAELVARVAETLRGGDDAAARAGAAADVEQLRTIVADAGGASAAPGFDLAQVAGALEAFATWLRSPTSASEAEAERAISDLQAAVGPLVGWDPARDDAARRAQYRSEARAALDEIFRDRPRKS